MLKKLHTLLKLVETNQFTQGKFRILILGFMVMYLAITVPALFQKHHFLYNLEPYPDALLYSLPSQNLAHGSGLKLIFENSGIKPWVPPLYSLVLTPVSFLWSSPASFYVTNLILGLLSLWGIGALLRARTRSLIATAVGLALYLSHSFILWLPGVAMSENLTLCLTAWLLYFVLKPEFKLKDAILTLLLALSLVMTRYALVITAATAVLIAIFRFWSHSSSRQRTWLLFGILGCATIFWVTASLVTANPLVLFQSMASQLFQTDSAFFSLAFIPKSVDFYWQALLGDRLKIFLWQFSPLSSWPILTLAIASFVSVWRQPRRELKQLAVFLVLLFLSQFGLLLHFYSQDSRYIVLSVPMLSVLIALTWNWLTKPEAKLVYLALILIFLPIHLWQQRSLFKQLVGNNLLGRSHGWQQEAALEWRSQLPKESWLISAIPPFLVNAYAPSHFHLLPLSRHQEFISKNQQAWSLPVNSESDLFAVYDSILSQEIPLYVSNAYLSHEFKVVTDFEAIKTHYLLEQKAAGCLGTCNLYRILGPATGATASASNSKNDQSQN